VKRTLSLFLLVLVTLALVAAGCGSSTPPAQNAPASKQSVELNVSAAVSMKDALAEIQKIYQEKNPNVKIIYNLGASGALQKQIEQGAPADLFIGSSQTDE